VDVAKEQGVDERIDFDGSRLLFSHNRRSFTEEELIHLIYHRSTKVESKGSSGKSSSEKLFLVEAKSHISEFISTLKAENKNSIKRITKSLEDTSAASRTVCFNRCWQPNTM
jgi:hypothetical protein